MKNWKTAFFVCLTFLIVSNCYWLLQLIDAELTNTYNGVTVQNHEDVIKILGEIIVEEGKAYSQKDVLFLLRQKYEDGFIVEDSNSVSYQGIEFLFKNDTLVSVQDIW